MKHSLQVFLPEWSDPQTLHPIRIHSFRQEPGTWMPGFFYIIINSCLKILCVQS